MKCVFVLIAILLLGCGSQDAKADEEPFNYLMAAFDYSIAIKHVHEDAYLYYGEYFTQELETISTRMANRMAEAITGSDGSESQGEAIQMCVRPAVIEVERLLLDVHEGFLILDWEAAQLYNEVYERMGMVNVMAEPFSELYYRFTERMFDIYSHLNEDILPKLNAEITELVTGSAAAYDVLDNCLNGIN